MGRILKLGLISVGVLAFASATGCQPDNTNTTNTAGTSGTAGSGNAGGTGGSSAGSAGSGNTAGTGGGTAGSAGDAGTAGTGGAGGTMMVDPCLDGATDATIYDVTKGVVGAQLKVKVDGVIAMSKKLLVSHSKSTGNCLWGVF